MKYEIDEFAQPARRSRVASIPANMKQLSARDRKNLQLDPYKQLTSDVESAQRDRATRCKESNHASTGSRSDGARFDDDIY